jgi:hypothetical protein
MSNPYDEMHLYASNNYMNGGYVDYTSSITPKLNKPPPQSIGNKYPQYVQDVYSYLDKQVMGGSGDNDAKMIPPPPVSGRNNNSTIIADLTKKLDDFQQRNMYFMFFIVVLIFYIIFKPDGLGYSGGHMGHPGGYMGGGYMPMLAQPVYTMPMMQPMAPMMAQPQPMQK